MATAEQSQQGHERSTDKQEYPFTAVLSEDGVKQMDLIHRHIEGLVSEYRLQITQSGWEIRVVDAANVAMIDVSIPTTVFSEYECSEDMEVRMDVSRLNDALTADKRITYGFTPDGERSFTVGDTDVKAIDPDSIRRELDLPDLNLPTTAVIEDIELFSHFCENTGEHVQISGSDEGIAIHCESGQNASRSSSTAVRNRNDSDTEKDVSNDTLLLPDGNGSDVRESTNNGDTRQSLHDRVADMHDGNETDVSLFSQDYLEGMFKKLLVRHKRDVSYELRLGTEFPLYLTRRDDSDIELTFMLAPRITGT